MCARRVQTNGIQPVDHGGPFRHCQIRASAVVFVSSSACQIGPALASSGFASRLTVARSSFHSTRPRHLRSEFPSLSGRVIPSAPHRVSVATWAGFELSKIKGRPPNGRPHTSRRFRAPFHFPRQVSWEVCSILRPHGKSQPGFGGALTHAAAAARSQYWRDGAENSVVHPRQDPVFFAARHSTALPKREQFDKTGFASRRAQSRRRVCMTSRTRPHSVTAAGFW